MNNGHSKKGIILGFGVLLAGLGILLGNLGILDDEIRKYILRWEMILIILGIFFLLSHDNKVIGVIMLLTGGIFYARDYFGLHFSFWQIFWPAMLILIGVLIIFKHRFPRAGCNIDNSDSDNIIDDECVFGGGEKKITSKNFKGGKILAIFGGTNYFFNEAVLAPGKNYIEIFALFGGVKFVIPPGWKVQIKVMPIFGGFSDKRNYALKVEDSTTESELIIKGMVFFGGGEIKSY